MLKTPCGRVQYSVQRRQTSPAQTRCQEAQVELGNVRDWCAVGDEDTKGWQYLLEARLPDDIGVGDAVNASRYAGNPHTRIDQ